MKAANTVPKESYAKSRDELLREMDDRVRNNLSLLLALVKIHMDSPPTSSLAALSRVAGQIMAISTAYDIAREGGREEDKKNAAELYARLIAGIEGDLLNQGAIRFTADTGTAAVPMRVATTLSVVFGEMLFDAIERASKAGRPPEIKVDLAYTGECRFLLRVTDASPKGEGKLAAEVLAKALGGELRTVDEGEGTLRELVFTTQGIDGVCADEKPGGAP